MTWRPRATQSIRHRIRCALFHWRYQREKLIGGWPGHASLLSVRCLLCRTQWSAFIPVIVLLLTGCTGVAGVIKAMAKDPASACATVSTVYGTAVVGRSNNEKVGVNVEGGRCTISPKPLQ